MKRKIYKYPYNDIIENEKKIFLFNQIYKKVITIKYKNGQIFYIIKNKLIPKKTKL